ncbi:hypothetical protein M8C21_028297 [Ambrosia artemisiifolia]|uniref:Cathepsin propeptide inhibitor domain-containing protein n=1 Tax=Ambrosia artemisiifolia TaxID=4212 RepID=A0AAD5BR62_AMBAR|nr:hypothetical protein M8C21_028297 [Ambrosia artemisiifolia]
MSESKAQEDRDRVAFEHWKLKWNKTYATSEEENYRFQNYLRTLRRVGGDSANDDDDDKSSPSWWALSRYADLTTDEFKFEMFGFNSVTDHFSSDSDSDDEMLAKTHIKAYQLVRLEDGTSRIEISYPSTTSPPHKHQRDDEKDTNKKEEKEPPLKLQKIGCDGKNNKLPGCFFP